MFSKQREFEQHSLDTDHAHAEQPRVTSAAQIDNKIVMLFELPRCDLAYSFCYALTYDLI